MSAGRRTALLVVLGALALAGLSIPLGARVSHVERNIPQTFLPRGSETVAAHLGRRHVHAPRRPDAG